MIIIKLVDNWYHEQTKIQLFIYTVRIIFVAGSGAWVAILSVVPVLMYK